MVECLTKSRIINKIFVIFLQIVLIFIFLTIFFFTYVGSVEKDTFKVQMNLIVDDLTTDINFSQFVPSGGEDVATVILDGSLEVARRNSLNDDKEKDDDISKQNTKIKNKAFLCVGISLIILLIIVAILSMTSHCIPFHIHAKEAFIVVFFVALTEIFFLNVITKNYLSIDPSNVRHQISESIHNWIKNKKSYS